jgi:hypothetical protein
MKPTFFTAILLFCSLLAISQANKYKVSLIGFYNLENLYDTVNNPKVNDEEFLPNAERQYNSRIYMDKLERLSTVISGMGTNVNPDGLAILGVSEIENDTVLTDLVNMPKLKARKLKFAHFDSPDARGVDVAMLYNPKYFTLLYSTPLFVQLPGGSKDAYFTRDVLYSKGLMDGDTIHVFVNHWPSRSGGEERSIPARAAAASVVKHSVDSITALNVAAKVVIMGDLNDDPISPSVAKVLNAKGDPKNMSTPGLYNPWMEMYKRGIGTLAYQDAWGLFDQIIVSSGWLDKTKPGYFYQKSTIYNEDFLVQKTGKFRGYGKRTWDGMTYNYGYSDHFPVYIMTLKKDE